MLLCVFLDTRVHVFLLDLYLVVCASSTFTDAVRVFVPVYGEAATDLTPQQLTVSTVTVTHSGRYAVVYHSDLKYIPPLFYQ